MTDWFISAALVLQSCIRVAHGGVAAVMHALQGLFDRVETFRWSLMEAQADADIAAGRVCTFDSAADALKFLDSHSE